MTGKDTGTVTDGGTPVPGTGSPAANVQPVTPPASTQPALSPEYAEDGKRWQDKYFGKDGELQKKQRDWATREGELQATIEGLKTQLEASRVTEGGLQTRVQSLEAQGAEITELRQKLQETQEQAEMANRYRTLMEYPNLLNITVQEQVPGEEGEEPKTVQVNPLLDLVTSTKLEGDELRKQIERLATALQQPTTASLPAEAPPKAPPQVPSPGTPAEETAQYWYEKAMELREKLNAGEGSMEELVEAWRKHAELSSPTAQ